MTQSDYPIYTLDAIHEDICFLVSYFFYSRFSFLRIPEA